MVIVSTAQCDRIDSLIVIACLFNTDLVFCIAGVVVVAVAVVVVVASVIVFTITGHLEAVMAEDLALKDLQFSSRLETVMTQTTHDI